MACVQEDTHRYRTDTRRSCLMGPAGHDAGHDYDLPCSPWPRCCRPDFAVGAGRRARPRESLVATGHSAARAGTHGDTGRAPGAHQAATQARPHRSALPILAVGRADAPHPRSARRHLPPLRGPHEASRPGPRPRKHRALPPSPGPVDRAARPCRGPAAALLPRHHPPQANPPSRAVRVGRALPAAGPGSAHRALLVSPLTCTGSRVHPRGSPFHPGLAVAFAPSLRLPRTTPA